MLKEELYKRQGELPLRKIESAIVVGLGGTGSWTALYLAMSGCERLHLMDSDHIELSNLNRLPFHVEGIVGKKKTEATSEFIMSRRPDCFITTDGRAGEFSLAAVPKAAFLFDCTDSHKVQLMLCEWAKKNKVEYIRSGYNGGTHLTVTGRVPTWGADRETTGYEIVPSWVVPAAIAAALAVSKAMYCPDTEISHDLKELGVKNEK